MQAWLALMVESPPDAMAGWFRSIRAVAAHLDVARLHAWLDLTREAILAGAPDRPRVVRHIAALEVNWTREMLDWSGGNGSAARRLARASERMLPRRVVITPALHQLADLIGPNSETLVIALPAPAPRPLIEPALGAIRAVGMARLGLLHLPVAGSAFFDPAGGDLRWTVDPDLVGVPICLAIDRMPAGMAIAC